MSQNLGTTTGAAFTDGLRKMSDILKVAKPLNDDKLVRQARRSVEKQVARLSALKLTDVDLSKPRSYSIPDGYRYVHFPKSADDNDPSGLTVFFNTDGSHAATVEALLTNPPGAHRLQMWSNGKPVADQTVEEDSTGHQLQPEFSWSVLNQCLSNAGVSGWTCTVIGVVCAVVCAGTAGIGCVPCIAGVAGIAGGTIGYCVQKAADS